MTRRAGALAVALVAVLVLGAPTTAHADAAGPTDYRSEVTSVDPPTPAIAVTVEGGDAFVRLVAQPGVDVQVLGYEGEPYLWFRDDGVVLENQRSPATWYNRERYGAPVPADADADADAAPDWVEVDDDGAYAWHDHRAHRMERFAPLNVERGEPVLDAVVPLVVDGRDVDVRVVSTWQPSPSPWPVWLGVIVGGLAGVVVVARRRRSSPAPVLLVVGAGATVVGWWQYRSLPPETEPAVSWWLVPAVATVLAGVGWWLRSTVAAWALSAVAALQLVLWAWQRRTGLTRAVLPTDAPFWLDRFVTSTTLVAGLVSAAAALAALVAPAITARRPAAAH